jgi:hypothetical protein
MIQHPCFITAAQAALPCISFAPLSRFLIQFERKSRAWGVGYSKHNLSARVMCRGLFLRWDRFA